MKPPVVWGSFCQYLDLSQREALRYWAALGRSGWTEPQALRQSIMLFQSLPWLVSVQAFREASNAPAVHVKALECLVLEGHLTRREATAIEEHIFARCDQDGHWRDLPQDPVRLQRTLARAVPALRAIGGGKGS